MMARIVVTTFVAVFAVVNIVTFIVLGQTRDKDERKTVIMNGFTYYVFIMEVIAILIMTTSIVILLIELKKLGSFLES